MKIYNLTKFEISKKLIEETGFSSLYSKKLVNDFFDCIKENIKEKKFKLKNIGTFKVLKIKSTFEKTQKTVLSKYECVIILYVLMGRLRTTVICFTINVVSVVKN